MMKIFTGAVLLGYGALTFGGLEPFSTAQKGAVPSHARRGPSGGLLWFGGISGGK